MTAPPALHPSLSRPAGRLLYLGEEVEPLGAGRLGRPFGLDPDRLTTHAACFGMTGSGKTGMCLVLLEEAIRLGIPLFLLDPKGDLPNLMLGFPGLSGPEFEPWVDPAQASSAGQSTAAFAEATAARWRDGLAAFGLGPTDVRDLRDAGRITLYTPGSTAGTPVNVLGGFTPPPADAWDIDPEPVRARITGTVAALLDLAGVAADPVKDPEGIVLSRLFEMRWRQPVAVTLESLVRDLLEPPEALRTLGAMDLESVFPKGRRQQVAMALNNLIAAPAFASWTQGDPLDPGAMAGAPGRPSRVNIFYLAHLSDAERSFFVATFLQAFLSWTRSLPGSSSLRALFYMDEIAGYVPPVANPPTKAPLVTMLKQARAFGVGAVLATQNPVDLDYKGLANIGTWFLGRLQTEQDRERLLDGLSATGIDRQQTARALAEIPPRTFVVHDAREPKLRAVAARFAMSYLRGPITREEVRRLAGKGAAGTAQGVPATPASATRSSAPAAAASTPPAGAGTAAPSIRPGRATREGPPAGVPERFGAAPAGALLVPALRARARIVFEEKTAGLHEVRHEDLVVPLARATDPQSLSWDEARPLAVELAAAPPGEATFADLPEAWRQASSWKTAATLLKSHLAATRALRLKRHPVLELTARPDETDEAFLERCRQEADRRGDEEALKLKERYERGITRLKTRAEKELRELELDRQQHEGRKLEEIVSAGETLLGMFLGGRRRSLGGAAGRRRMTAGSAARVEKSEAEYQAAHGELDRMQQEAEQELADLDARWEASARAVSETIILPKKTAIEVMEISLLWTPEITA